MIRTANRRFCSPYFAIGQPIKSVWRKIEQVGANDSNEKMSLPVFDSEEFCTFFTELSPGAKYDHHVQDAENSFRFNAVTKHELVRLDNIHLKFVKGVFVGYRFIRVLPALSKNSNKS